MRLKLSFLKYPVEIGLFFGFILTSFGILLVTVGGSWDITNHLLNKPETFFSPPHALLYLGVAIALLGSVTSFFTWKYLEFQNKKYYKKSIVICLLGLVLLIGAGPIDFLWHSNFGLDGLLSPPHLTLISGMVITSIGSMIGISKFILLKNNMHLNYLYVLAILPVWLSTSGLFHSLSLPFSNTDFFNFNPDPMFGAFFASVAFPFLISFCLLLSSSLSRYQFGILSVTGFFFLLVSSSTSILPNFGILSLLPFYFLSLIPIISADVLLRLFHKHKTSILVSGGILGSSFLMIYFPLSTYTYNEVLSMQTVWPSLISNIYFQIIDDVFLITLIPSLFMGIIGAVMTKKLTKNFL